MANIKNNGWIFVEDKLPKPETPVLVYTSYDQYCVAMIEPNGDWTDPWEEWIYYSEAPIAWMELPDPPEKNDE